MLKNKNHIFVIEDNSFYKKLLKTILDKSDNNVICLDGTEDMIKELNIYNPFLIIIDMHLTNNIEGINIIKLIRATNLYSKIPIIAISAHMNKIKQVQLENLFCHALNKPIEIETLIELVQQIKDSA